MKGKFNKLFIAGLIGMASVLPISRIVSAAGNTLDAADGNPANVVVVDNDGNVGVGIGAGSQTAATALHITNGDGSTSGLTIGGDLGFGNLIPFQIVHPNTNIMFERRNEDGGLAPDMIFSKTRGTFQFPTEVLFGDRLGIFSFRGHDGVNSLSIGAAFGAEVDGAVELGKVPGKLFFSTSDASGTLRERMTINKDGHVGIGAKLDVNGVINATGGIKVGNDVSACTNTNAGAIRFNGSIFEGCDGLAWVALNSPATPSFTCGIDQVQDADGNLYNTVLIGTQCWMAENLNVGTMVNSINTGVPHSDQFDNGVIEKYCDSNDPNICLVDGGLYEWDEIMQYTNIEGVQGICPSGWHIPTDTEWTTMEMEGTSGFQTLFPGIRMPSGPFFVRGGFTQLWTSTESGVNVWTRSMSLGDSSFTRLDNSKEYFGYSVRCVKD